MKLRHLRVDLGDNLYTCSILALNPDTGELVSSAEIDALVARARRIVEEDGRSGVMP